MSMTSQTDLSAILSSQARFLILQTLSLLTEGLGLRELERQTQLGIRSVQVATQALITEGILKKSKTGLLRLNGSSAAARSLQGLFKYLRDQKLNETAHLLSERARRALQLSDEVAAIVRRAKRSK